MAPPPHCARTRTSRNSTSASPLRAARATATSSSTAAASAGWRSPSPRPSPRRRGEGERRRDLAPAFPLPACGERDRVRGFLPPQALAGLEVAHGLAADPDAALFA